MVRNNNKKNNQVMNPFAAFCAKHKDADVVRACAMHYRTNPYNYILGWLERNKFANVKLTDVATALMSKYGLRFI